MLLVAIITCEILFWTFIILGLVFRYLLHRRLIGNILLFCTPLIDLTLLIVTALSIKSGDEVSFAHGLAAVYIGVSIAFGRQMIAWADKHFAYRFAHGKKPQKKYGKEHAQNERKGWFHHLLAWIIGSAILFGMHFFVNGADRSGVFTGIIAKWSLILIIDFLISFRYTIWPRTQK